jgi:hypothetical protein
MLEILNVLYYYKFIEIKSAYLVHSINEGEREDGNNRLPNL